MFNHKTKHSYIDLLEGAAIGASLATMTTFLFGTKKGKEFQKELIDQYKKLKHRAEDIQEKFHKATTDAEKTLKKARKIKKTVKKTH